MKVNLHKFTIKFQLLFHQHVIRGVWGKSNWDVEFCVSVLTVSLSLAEKYSGSAFTSWKFLIINMFPNLLLILCITTLVYFTYMCIMLIYTYIYNVQKSLTNRTLSITKKETFFHCKSSVYYSPGLQLAQTYSIKLCSFLIGFETQFLLRTNNLIERGWQRGMQSLCASFNDLPNDHEYCFIQSREQAFTFNEKFPSFLRFVTEIMYVQVTADSVSVFELLYLRFYEEQ